MPQAEFTLRNLDTNAARQFTTGDDGIYSFAAMLPGRYEQAAVAQGLAEQPSRSFLAQAGTYHKT